MGAAGLVALLALLFLAPRAEGPITDPTFYRGPILNHRGDLVDYEGHILRHAAATSGEKH